MPITVYKCSKCGAVYSDERDAGACEGEHFNLEVSSPEKVNVSCSYEWGEIYPSGIVLKVNGRLAAIYKRVKEL